MKGGIKYFLAKLIELFSISVGLNQHFHIASKGHANLHETEKLACMSSSLEPRWRLSKFLPVGNQVIFKVPSVTKKTTEDIRGYTILSHVCVLQT
jgi:hypothetical protein